MRRPTLITAILMLLISMLYVSSMAPVSRARGAMARSEALPEIAFAFSEAWSSGDPDQLVAIYAEDALFEEVVLGGAVTHGRDELRTYAGAVFAAFPDFTAAPVNAFASGNRVVVEWTLIGTYTGQFGPLPPGSGQEVAVRVATVLELTDNGLIQRDSEYWDFSTVLTQLGVMARTESAATPAP